MLVAHGRIRLDREVGLWVRHALNSDRVEAIQLTSESAVAASLLPAQFPGDPADRLIYATANGLGVPLVTRDDRIGAYDPARVIW